MPHIHLETFIDATVELCFDLARNIDVHTAAAGKSKERAVAGVCSGLINLGETVTWEAIHFGVRQKLTSKIVAFDRPHMFADEMQRGAFKRWHHTHLFARKQHGTLMIDEVNFASPLGVIGRIVDSLVLEEYMKRLLLAHNSYIKNLAEQRKIEHADKVSQ